MFIPRMKGLRRNRVGKSNRQLDIWMHSIKIHLADAFH